MSNQNALQGIYEGLSTISTIARNIFSKTWKLEKQRDTTDVRLIHLKGLEAGMGPLVESIERSGSRYNAVFTDAQLSIVVMSLREGVQIQDAVMHEQASKTVRAVACENVIMELMPEDEEDALSIEQLTDGDEQFFEDMITDGLLNMTEDQARSVARVLAEAVSPTSLNHELTSQVYSLAHELAEHKAAAEAVSQADSAMTQALDATKGVVVHQSFGRRKDDCAPAQQIS